MEIPMSVTSFNFTNCSTSLPEVAPEDIASQLWQQIYIVGVSVVATSANVIVIVCLWRDPSSEVSGFSTYAVSVAFTDLLVGVVIMSLRLMVTIPGTWPFGTTGCILWRHTDFGLTSVSMFLFLAMAYDRYNCVTAPLQYRSQFRTTRPAWISLFVWIVGFVLWTPYLLLKTLKNGIDCFSFPYGPKVLEAIQFTVAYYIPISALIIMNSILLWTLNTRNTRSQTSATSGGQRLVNISTVSGIRGHNSRPRQPVKSVPVMVSKRKLSKTRSSYKIVLLVVVFCVCWLPYCVIWPVTGLCPTCIPSGVKQLLSFLTYGQSAINPLIVISTSHKIRSKIARACLKRTCINTNQS